MASGQQCCVREQLENSSYGAVEDPGGLHSWWYFLPSSEFGVAVYNVGKLRVYAVGVPPPKKKSSRIFGLCSKVADLWWQFLVSLAVFDFLSKVG